MKAFVLEGPRSWSIAEVPRPEPESGEVVVAVSRVGLCGTDAEFFRGTQPYLAAGTAHYPIRIGHEWCGRVVRIGAGTSTDWLGQRVTADTMLGCRACAVCARGRQHLCPNRTEIGVLGGRHGALAEEIAVPVTALHLLPDTMSDALGALVEPVSLAFRAVQSLALRPGDPVIVWGAGAIGLAAIAIGASLGFELTLVARSPRSFALARRLGAASTVLEKAIGAEHDGMAEAGLSATPTADGPLRTARLVRDGGQLLLIGIAGQASPLEARDIVIRDLRVTGLLSGSPAFAPTIDFLSTPDGKRLEELVGAVHPLEHAAGPLSGAAAVEFGRGPKHQIDLAR